jgi:hypothetical protein
MAEMVDALHVNIHLDEKNKATISYQGRSATFVYIYDTTRNDATIRGDVINYLIAESAVRNYSSYEQWKEDTGLSREHWKFALSQYEHLQFLLDEDLDQFIQQYNVAQ